MTNSQLAFLVMILDPSVSLLPCGQVGVDWGRDDLPRIVSMDVLAEAARNAITQSEGVN